MSTTRAMRQGDVVLYPGDVCNQPATCTVTRVGENRWGKFFDAVELGGEKREFKGMSPHLFGDAPNEWKFAYSLETAELTTALQDWEQGVTQTQVDAMLFAFASDTSLGERFTAAVEARRAEFARAAARES